jgi:hypothetical protein
MLKTKFVDLMRYMFLLYVNTHTFILKKKKMLQISFELHVNERLHYTAGTFNSPDRFQICTRYVSAYMKSTIF